MPVWEFTSNVQLSDFALDLRFKRRTRNLSYEMLGERVGINPARLMFFEMDKLIPTKKEKKALAKFFI